MITERLKAETRERHVRVEALVSVMLDCREHEMILVRFLGIYRALEAELAKLDWSNTGIVFADRRKTALLERDLGTTRGETAPAIPLPDLAAGFGCLYVLEGATLGGQVILRSLPENGDNSFFKGYGDRTGEMWRGFREALVTFCDSAEKEAAVVASALRTFELFERWLKR